jgi:endonuclease-3
MISNSMDGNIGSGPRTGDSARTERRARPPSGGIAEMLRRVNEALVCMYGAKQLTPNWDPVGEMIHIILTQNTSDVNSDRTYAALRHAYASWEDVAAAPPAEIADLIRIGGLADIKAGRIVDVLARLEADYGHISLEALCDMNDDEAFDYLTSLPGVGPKTAACVLLFAMGRPVFPVDTHVHRVANRIGLVDTKQPAATQAELAPAVPDDIVYQLHMNMVEHGRLTCRALRPECECCALSGGCAWAKTRAVGEDATKSCASELSGACYVAEGHEQA